MSPNNIRLAAALLGSVLGGWGCAGAPTECRVDGVAVPGTWVEVAEKGGSAGLEGDQAQACIALSKKLWERNALEALRFLRKGSLLRDAECCRQYLIHAEAPSVNLSQRAYARLFIEGLLRQGPLAGAQGKDVRRELYQQLCWAWRFTEPRSPRKARQVLETLLDLGLDPDQENSPLFAQMIRECGGRPARGTAAAPIPRDVQLYAADGAEEPRRLFRVPSSKEAPETGDWIVSDANPWGGGSDRLLLSANVLAFLVNDKGEPSFRGTQLWICNLGDAPVFLSSLAVGQNNRELLPGREVSLPLSASAFVTPEGATGIPISVRHHRIAR